MVVFVSIGLIENALRDSKFKGMFPEFNGVPLKSKDGCKTCGGRSQKLNNPTRVSVFLRVMESLAPNKLAAFKKYFNAGSLQYRLNNEVRTL
jgi:hypothetical protein